MRQSPLSIAGYPDIDVRSRLGTEGTAAEMARVALRLCALLACTAFASAIPLSELLCPVHSESAIWLCWRRPVPLPGIRDAKYPVCQELAGWSSQVRSANARAVVCLSLQALLLTYSA